MQRVHVFDVFDQVEDSIVLDSHIGQRRLDELGVVECMVRT
jgi:hypothetical protein